MKKVDFLATAFFYRHLSDTIDNNPCTAVWDWIVEELQSNKSLAAIVQDAQERVDQLMGIGAEQQDAGLIRAANLLLALSDTLSKLAVVETETINEQLDAFYRQEED